MTAARVAITAPLSFGPVQYRAVAIDTAPVIRGVSGDDDLSHSLFSRIHGGAYAAGLIVVILGIHRGDHGKRLTGVLVGNSEAFARRLLTGSRGYDSADDTGEGQ